MKITTKSKAEARVRVNFTAHESIYGYYERLPKCINCRCRDTTVSLSRPLWNSFINIMALELIPGLKRFSGISAANR